MTTEQQEKQKKTKNSKFITNLSWVFIGFFGYASLSSLLQSIFFFIKPAQEFFQGFFSGIDIMAYLSPAFLYVLKNMHLFSLVSFVVSLVTFIASFAFFKRRDWARIFFVVFLLLTIVVSFTGIFFHQAFLLESPADKDMQEVLKPVNQLIDVFLVVFAIIVTGLHGWLAYKLLAKDVKEEFASGGQGGAF